MELRIAFWNDGLTANYLSVSFDREDIECFSLYLKLVTGEIATDHPGVIQLMEKGILLEDGGIIFPYEDNAGYSQEEKQKSWENIFDISCSFDGDEQLSLSTQATMWEIKAEWVMKAESFIAR